MDAWSTIIGGAIALAGAFGTAYMNRKSEEKKQKLQFEHSKLQMVFDDRKASCRKIIDEIYKAVKMVRLYQPYDNAWEPIKKEYFESTSEALTKEFIFVDEKAEQALKLFLNIMSDTVLWDWETDPSFSHPDKDRMIRRAYEELEYLSEHITGFLRSQIYLTNEEPLIQSKVALLKICRFVCDERFKELKFSNQDIIKLNGWQSPMEIIRLAESNMSLFKSELTNFFSSLKTNYLNDKNREYFMPEIAKIEKLLPYI
ncbi:MAG: hypothetical protein A2Y80_01755 [Deltaproteobacteria bacterium RBG_13_58_19]|nr:MAG: hypothetical protein A2Y80_01755 [Deltaproteobacteria bacterium RBG_13_58_19]